MLTPQQIDLVQDSFAEVVPITDAAAAEFYRRLFEMAPDTRALFRHDMAEQGRKLFLRLRQTNRTGCSGELIGVKQGHAARPQATFAVPLLQLVA